MTADHCTTQLPPHHCS